MEFMVVLKWLGIVVVVVVILSMLGAFVYGMIRGATDPDAFDDNRGQEHRGDTPSTESDYSRVPR